MFVRTRDIPEMATAHGEKYPSRKRPLVKRGVIPSVMQMAYAWTEGPVDSRDFDPPEGHRHPTGVEWYYILGGNATFYIGDGDSQEIHEAKAGDFLVVPENMLHYHIVPDGVRLELFYGLNATDEV